MACSSPTSMSHLPRRGWLTSFPAVAMSGRFSENHSPRGKDTVHQAVDLRARERPFHPVRDYLNSLRWDGIKRIDTWLTEYLGAEQTEYTRAIGRMFLVGVDRGKQRVNSE